MAPQVPGITSWGFDLCVVVRMVVRLCRW